MTEYYLLYPKKEDELSHSVISPLNNSGTYLIHHGIKGQKWGVRRFQNYDGTLTAAGKRRQSGGRTSKSRLYAETVLSFVPGGGMATLAADAIIGASKRVAASNRLKKDDERRNQNTNFDKKTGLRLKNKEWTESEDLKAVNPGFSEDLLISDKKTTNNCVYCSAAYELRRRGYDVRAKKSETGSGVSESDILKLWNYKDQQKMYVNPGSINPLTSTKAKRKACYEEVMGWVSKQPDQRGSFGIQWGPSGHSMVYEIKNGKLSILDAQSNNRYNDGEKYLKELFGLSFNMLNTGLGVTDVDFLRTDNATPNWEELKKLVE